MSPGKLVHHGKLLRLCLLQRIQKCCNSLTSFTATSSLSLSGVSELSFPFFDARLFSAGVSSTMGLDEVLFLPVASLDSASI